MVEKVKALFFIPSLEGGGAERAMSEILHHMNKEKIEAVLILLYPCDSSPYRDYLPRGLKIIVVERASDNVLQKIKQYAAFLKIVYDEKPHVVMSMLTYSNIMAISAKLLFGGKIIIGEHNTLSEITKTKEGRQMLWFSTAHLVKIFYRFADKIIAVSGGVKTDLVEKFRIAPHNIRVIHNPIDLKRIPALCGCPGEHRFFREEVPIIVSVGRLVPQKGYDVLLKSFSMVVKEMDARLMILGEGPEKESLSRLANDLAIGEKVSFVGFLNNPFAFISKADVFVLSSHYEGLPTVILEAMACGIPVVSTDCKYGPREILENGHYGLLVPTGDADALSREIVSLLKNRVLRERLSRLGKERIKDFSPERIIQQYEDIIYGCCT
ncbi:MAG TPA: glycosyltransferase [Thermodesulfovibrionales bacterium]|nr:glycosyltransferase [Thermodesulfovibrionales bacterium]